MKTELVFMDELIRIALRTRGRCLVALIHLISVGSSLRGSRIGRNCNES